MIDAQNLQNIAVKVENILEENTEWIPRYAKYAEIINFNRAIIETVRKSFKACSPLYVYTNISKVKQAKKYSVSFDLRYRGQSIAEVYVKKEGIILKTNNNVFDYYKIEGGKFINWNDKDATVFRKAFKDFPERINKGKKNEEHRFESALITELSKNKGIEKSVINIQPVLLCKNRFQMPTPLSASGNKISYVSENGGGIDLLCRTRNGVNKALNIFELKDEYNEKSEPPQKVLQQAVAYTIFISKLLKTPEAGGKIWWELFNLGKIDRPLDINAVAAMPYNKKGKTDFFENKHIQTIDNSIGLHYFYFDINNKDNVMNVKTSLKRGV